MPHIIIEFSKELVPEPQITTVLDAIHQTVISSKLFEPEKVKSRAIPVTHYRVGVSNGFFIHVQIRMHAGRNESQKKLLSKSILEVIQGQNLGANAITVEIVDMDRNCYARFST